VKEEVDRFVVLAREFCTLLETAIQLEPVELRTRLLRVLPALYVAGSELALPDTDAEYEDVTLQLDLLVALSQHLGERDRFWQVFDPTHKAKPLESSLALELSEIRHDLQKGLIALERGAPLEAVLWEWRFGLDAHWGNHLVNALRAVHWQQAW
jgi:uncharacterized protein DUF5063